MAIFGPKTYPWAVRASGGSLRLKNAWNVTFGYTETFKEVAAGTTTAVLAATAGATSSQTVTSGLTDPDVPRALSVTSAGTGADLQAGSVVVNGTNVEGKSISESFNFTEDDEGVTKNGSKAFRTVTSVVIPPMLGTGVTFSVGTRNLLGVNHRLYKNNTTVKVYSYTAPGEGGGMPTSLTLQAAPTVVADDDDIENNLVTPATTPDGTTALTIFYAYDNWAVAPVNDEPEYSTTTSTSSTSTSTSTSTITTSTSSTSSSTSSTSVSTSSTSTSVSTTSTSTSSTSTSTTTVP